MESQLSYRIESSNPMSSQVERNPQSYTAQVVFLIDNNVGRQSFDLQKLGSLLRLSCLRILSSLSSNSLYKHVRWGYVFYNLDSLPLTTHRHTSWKDFNLETFEDFEDKLDSQLSRQSALVATPRKARKAERHGEDDVYLRKAPSAVYSNVLCAVIEDFQWEMPDICSPIKSVRGRAAQLARNASASMVKNFVFNFQLSPSCSESLSCFAGRECTKPSHLTNSVLSLTARQKWREKQIALYWVNSDCHTINLGEEISRIYKHTLEELGGRFIHITQLSQLSTALGRVALPSVFRHTQPAEAPVTCVQEQICHLFMDSSVKMPISSQKLNICTSGNSVILYLAAVPLCQSSELSVEYLYVSGVVPSSSVRLEYLNNTINYLCMAESSQATRKSHHSNTTSNSCNIGKTRTSAVEGNSMPTHSDTNSSRLCRLLVELSANNHVMVLECKVDNSYYILQPLTIDKITLVMVNPSRSADIVNIISTAAASHVAPVLPDGIKALTGQLISQSAPLQPIRLPSTNLSSSKQSDRKARGMLKLESLQEIYRRKLDKRVLVDPADLNKKSTEKKSADSKLPTNAVVKPPTLSRGSSMVQIVTTKQRSSTETAMVNTLPAAAGTLARKKIATTILSSLDLRTESELLTYITNSYESAVTGQADLYLTAQSIVNTARVFYKQELNIENSVEELLSNHIIKSSRSIRKSFMSDGERKSKECKMSALLILELQSLKHELSVEDYEWGDTEAIVSTLEEYMTCMSMGKPHVLREFLLNLIVPSYQLTLAPLIAALLKEFGQDLPLSLKRLTSTELETRLPSLSSVSSLKSNQVSPASSMVPSLSSLLSEPDSSLMSSTMFTAGVRNLRVKSRSDVGRRSIAVPGELLKKRKKGHRLSDPNQSIASRTRSKTPKKDQPLTEFPVGFLTKLKGATSLSQPQSDVRRSPRIAASMLASEACAPVKHKVKRDLFASPTSAARRNAGRSPRRLRTTQKDPQLPSEKDNNVLVAETPLRKQGQGQRISALVGHGIENCNVIGEKFSSPAKKVIEESPMKTESADEVPKDETTTKTSTAGRLTRNRSFYDIEHAKSRNIEKFELLEQRLKSSSCIGSNGSSVVSRRVAKLIFKQALSLPTNRVSTRSTPSKDLTASPLTTQIKPRFKSSSLSDDIKPSQPKKKLFASPSPVKGRRANTILSTNTLVPETPEKEAASLSSTTPSDEPMVVERAAYALPLVRLSPSNRREEQLQRKRKLSSSGEQMVLSTPTKSQTVCSCGTPTATLRSSRKSPRGSPCQQKLCRYTENSARVQPLAFTQCVATPRSTPSPKRLNFQSRKRGTDPLSLEGKRSPSSETGVISPCSKKLHTDSVLTSNHLSNQHANAHPEDRSTDLARKKRCLLSPHSYDVISPKDNLPEGPDRIYSTNHGATVPQAQALTPVNLKVQTISSASGKVLRVRTTPKYSPMTAGAIHSLLHSPFTNSSSTNTELDKG